MNLGTYLDTAVAKFQDKPLLQFYDQTISFKEFGDQVNKLANGLKKLGFNKGDFIHVYVQNGPEVLISYFAIQKIGAIAGPINGFWKAAEVEYLLNDSKGAGLIIEDQYIPILNQIRSKCPDLKTVIEIGQSPASGHVSFATLMADSSNNPVLDQSAPEDLAFIFYTSGTTGNPKGVLLSHKNVLADKDGIAGALHLPAGKTILIFLPMFHVNAMLTSYYSIEGGFQIVLRKGFSATEFWEVVSTYKVNFWSAVPAVYQILLSDPGSQKYDLSSLEFGICGAAPLTEETMKQFEKTFNIPIVEGYGLTEATCVSTINPRDGIRKVGSIGLGIPGQEVKIVDEEGNECPPDKPGEIVIKGDPVMVGYYNRPDETAKTIREGWLHSGDVGYKDEDGYIFIVDRIKDMIIRGGENIYPKEIDNFLATHPKIAEAATIGVPDKIKGEEVKAFIVAADDSLTEEEVLQFCRDNVAAYKVPKYIEILAEDFPRSPVGKVLKKELKKWGLTPRPKKKKSAVTVADIFGTMESRVNSEGVKGVTANYGYHITGEGGGDWTVSIKDGAVKVMTGIHDSNVEVTISAKDWIALTLGTLDGMTAFTTGKLKATGDVSLLMKATKFFKPYTPPQAEPEVTVENIFETLENRVNPEGIHGVTASYGYKITGEGGGDWTVKVADNSVKVMRDIHEPDVTATIAAKDWIALTLGKLDPMTAFTTGKIKVEGNMGLLTKVPKFFKPYQPPQAQPTAEEVKPAPKPEPEPVKPSAAPAEKAPPKPEPPKSASEVTVADIFGTMESRVNPDKVAGVTANFAYHITGEGGGDWTITITNGTVEIREGIHDPKVTANISAQDFIDLNLGKLDGMTAFTSGKLKIEGDLGLMSKSAKFFQKYSPPKAEPVVSVADIFNTMEARVNPEGVKGVTANFSYKITGDGGGEWTTVVKDGTVKVLVGIHDPQVTTIMAAQDFIDLNLGKLDGMKAFSAGKLKVEGNMGLLTKAARFFKKYRPPAAAGDDEPKKQELIMLKQTLSIRQRFSTGPLMGKFLSELRDNKRILGNKCPKCGRLQTPPREICAICRIRVEELVEIGPEGVVGSYDITYYASPDPLTGESRETPYCAAFIRLDGCSGNDVFWHEIKPDHIKQLKRGVRVRPVWAEERTGAITDIKYFEIIA
ncbi:long-chain-fatty-acid--CoA ligase [candidate division CSSED10-310 bacterium]|uniref:Long-chain-fatty-acid--CoA ligase n=1 Tax=candidate division CSSED10-310 bacterium TaxID=2855610 RepID=A0ABV6YZW6_UNCC1